MSTQRDERDRHDSPGKARARAGRMRAAWALLLLLAAPFVAGAKGCDQAVVGNECPKGTAPAKSARCGGNAGNADAGQTVVDGGSAGAVTCGGLRGVSCPAGEYCNFPPGAMCGAADQTGTCAPKPEVCTEQYAPVCGCDGKTYGNDCEAASHGTSVASDGACPGPVADAGPTPTTCGGLLGTGCPSGEYCNFPASAMCGAADQTGTCATQPQICNDLAMPVCGCDGKTYPNSCYAARSGVSVATQASCATPPTGKTCGGLAGFQCAKGEYCNYQPAANCGITDQTGTCATIPTACTKEYVPVCGCDGKTYGNACMAAAASMGLSANMACPAQSCGSRGLPACPSGQYCNFPTSAMCGAADAPGTCATIPQVCTQEYAPVCGCDGKTYGNACTASAAGQSVATTGACAKP